MSAQTVGHFRIERLVGQGGMGAVYRGLDTRLGRRVALKFIRPERAGHPNVRERMRREARALSRLNHPNICQVYELFERPEGDVLVVEWVDGNSLGDRLLLEGPLSSDETLRIVLRVARALGEAHAHGVVHRDLKPANVMLSVTGDVKVLDFGLARIVGRGETSEPENASDDGAETDPLARRAGAYSDETPLTAIGRVPGTRGYIPPEAKHGAKPTEKGDVFALGVTAYELLSGRLPLAGSSSEPGVPLEKRMKPLAQVAPAAARGRARPFAALVGRMLDLDPGSRPTAAEVVRDCERLLDAPARLRKRVLLGGVSLFVLLLAGAFVAATRPAVRGLAKGKPATIVVLPIRNGTGEARYDALLRTALPELLGATLRVDSKLSVLSSGALAQAWKTLAIAPASELTDADRRRVARLLAVRLTLDGVVKRSASELTLDYWLRETGGNVLRSGSVSVPPRTRDILIQPLAAAAAEAVLSAIDPLGTGRRAVPAMQTIPADALGDFAAAKEAAQRGDTKAALALARKAAIAAPLFAPAPVLVAGLAAETGNHEMLEEFAAWGMGAAHTTGDLVMEVQARRFLAMAAGQSGNVPLELSRLEQTMAAALASGDPVVIGGSRYALAEFHYRRGNVAAMEREARAAVDIARTFDLKSSEARWSQALGLSLAAQGREREAIPVYMRAAELCRQTGDLVAEGYALLNRGEAEADLGNAAEAQAALSDALDRFRRFGSKHAAATTLAALGEIRFRSGDLAGAESRFREGLAIGREMGSPDIQHLTLNLLARVLLARGELEEARADATEALGLARKMEASQDEMLARIVLAEIAFRQRDSAGALRLRREAYALAKRTSGMSPADVARAAAALSESLLAGAPPVPEEARELLAEIEKTGESRLELALARSRLFALDGKPADALAALGAALKEAERLEPRRVPEVRADLARLQSASAKTR